MSEVRGLRVEVQHWNCCPLRLEVYGDFLRHGAGGGRLPWPWQVRRKYLRCAALPVLISLVAAFEQEEDQHAEHDGDDRCESHRRSVELQEVEAA